MDLLGERVLLRVYLQSADRSPHAPTYQRIVHAARAKHLAGATVIKGIMGFGARGEIPPPGWSISEHVPVIVEIVDAADRIISFLDDLGQLMIGGMATLERAAVMMYRHREHEMPLSLKLAEPVQPLSTLGELQSRSHMDIRNDGVLLRIFIGESDRFDGKPLHQAILRIAREMGLAGATVLRGVEGFGAHSIVHQSNLLAMSSDLPIVVEMVDAKEKIEAILPKLETMVVEGMITVEQVMILAYRDGEK
jgi:uncharacterized protein